MRLAVLIAFEHYKDIFKQIFNTFEARWKQLIRAVKRQGRAPSKYSREYVATILYQESLLSKSQSHARFQPWAVDIKACSTSTSVVILRCFVLLP